MPSLEPSVLTSILPSDPNFAALEALGWTPSFHQQWLRLRSEQPELSTFLPARVSSVERGEFLLAHSAEEQRRRAVLSGRLEASLHERDLPCVGDFVLSLSTAPGQLSRIEHVFERSSLFCRKSAGNTARPQAIAANVDLGIVVGALPPADADPHALRHGISPRRIERYLHAIADAPARALVALSKADLNPNAEAIALELSRELGGTEVVVVSARSGAGVDRLAREIARSGTAVLVGSSGVGKSSLLNRLLGHEVQRTAEVRATDTRGRHTTTRRELFSLNSGGVLIDTPGMRELALAAPDEENQGSGFGEIDELAGGCKFRDCRHRGEPGCAVQAAVNEGRIAVARLEHAHRLERELAFQRAREQVRDRRARRQRGRQSEGSFVTERGDDDDGD